MTSACWWQTDVIYQIYPRSFLDRNGDGIGDLRGIAARLDYLVDLGVGAIWISPIFASPMADFGYDISDYNSIDPLFGTMADFDALIKAAHDRHLKVILDFVPNHTSDQHPWFQQSRASRDNPRRDWYIWRNPAQPGVAPNNWLSEFGGSAWEFDGLTGQYYYHAFLTRQPDLNWRNPAVRSAMHEVLRFWLRKGVDGFRVDVIWHLVKDDQYRDNPINPQFRLGDPPNRRLVPLYTTDRPEVHDLIAAMRRVIDEFDDRVLIGEIYLPIERLIAYYGRDLSGVHLPFNFSLIGARWQAQSIAKLIDEYEAALPPGGWPNWVLGNHDRPRIASRVGPDQARVAAMLLLTLRGTPTLYYGDELGMTDVPIPPDRVQDPFEKNVPGQGLGRDPERTPMPWEPGPGAGFTTGQPWLPLGADADAKNVAGLREDPGSILSLYRRLLALRRTTAALVEGSWAAVPAPEGVLAYRRSHEQGAWLIALNLTAAPHDVASPAEASGGRVRLSTHLDRADEAVGKIIALRPDEGLVIECR